MGDTDVNLNIMMVGDSSVGKTSLLMRFIDEKFEETSPTVGIDYMRKTIDIGGIKVLTRFWDSAGTEKFSSMAENTFKNTAGVVLVYDVTCRESFKQLRFWLYKIREKSRQNVKIMLIGNKIDLIEKREVSSEEGSKYASENELFFMECSAKSDEEGNVPEAFNVLVQESYKVQKDVHTQRMSIAKPILPARTLSHAPSHESNGKKCC